MRMNRQMTTRTWIFLLFIAYCKNGAAQDSIHRFTKPIFTEVMLLYDFPESYGMTAGTSLPLQSLIKNTTSKKGKTFTKQRDIIVGANAGFYRYPYNYTGILLTPFIGFRHYVNPSFFHETTLGIGVLRTFYDGMIYKVDAGGNVNEENLFGRFYATTGFSWAANFLLQRPNRSIMTIQLKPTLWFQYPYDSFIKPHISLEAGIKYQIAERSVLVKTKTKNKK